MSFDDDEKDPKHPCNAQHWSRDSILKLKISLKTVLNKKFNEGYFVENIKILYPLFRYRSKSKNKRIIDSIVDIYRIEAGFNIIPIKIDYFTFNARFNNKFAEVLHHECGHADVDPNSKFRHCLPIAVQTMMSLTSPYVTIRCISKRIMNNLKYTPRLDNIDHYKVCLHGCCSKCAELATPVIIDCCYELQRYNRSIDKTIPDSPVAPINIDTLCLLCIWLANIMQHRFIKAHLQINSDLMPTIFQTLYGLIVFNSTGFYIF